MVTEGGVATERGRGRGGGGGGRDWRLFVQRVIWPSLRLSCTCRCPGPRRKGHHSQRTPAVYLTSTTVPPLHTHTHTPLFLYPNLSGTLPFPHFPHSPAPPSLPITCLLGPPTFQPPLPPPSRTPLSDTTACFVHVRNLTLPLPPAPLLVGILPRLPFCPPVSPFVPTSTWPHDPPLPLPPPPPPPFRTITCLLPTPVGRHCTQREHKAK